MANYRGLRLMPGESWSVKFSGFIDKGDGSFRKPIPRTNQEGRVVYHSSYYLLKECCVCGADTLKEKGNMRSYQNAVCGKDCFSKLKSKPDGSKKFKRASAGDHVMVKQKQHPFANKMGDVAEHRLVMEKHIGRYLFPHEYVHHINLLKDDNKIENLVLFSSASDHFKSHGTLNKCVSLLISKRLLTFDKNTNSYTVV